MPRRMIPLVPGCFYHVYNRGNNREAIFFEQENYLYFLQRVKKYLLPTAEVIAYCLMPTHYHILIQVKQIGQASDVSPVSTSMMRLSVSYTKAINKRFGRVGVLFQGPFQARLVRDSAHLLQLCRYVHANPVKDGLVRDPADWPFSNYVEWIGQRDGELLDREFVSAQFPEPGSYQEFVQDYIRQRCLPDEVRRHLAGIEA